ncbi:hypothetical protein SESBI_15779 [Sesbania bispinosa]|nr:hypothetical protein SESBI_15779 [Sesbania bispinosa]
MERKTGEERKREEEAASAAAHRLRVKGVMQLQPLATMCDNVTKDSGRRGWGWRWRSHEMQ